MTVKYHIKPNGEPGTCVAKVSCKYGIPLGEHYTTGLEAQQAYEKSMAAQTLITHNTTTNETKRISVLHGDYTFTTPTSEYGIHFIEPNIEGVYLQESPNGYEFYYRFEELHDIFTTTSPDDIRPGYSLDVELNTLQYVVSKEIVDEYAKEKNPFCKSKFVYGDEDFDEKVRDSIPTLAIIKGEIFIIDGNHRFAAARQKGMTAFAGSVVEFSDDMEDFWDVEPDEFNLRFSRPKN